MSMANTSASINMRLTIFTSPLPCTTSHYASLTSPFTVGPFTFELQSSNSHSWYVGLSIVGTSKFRSGWWVKIYGKLVIKASYGDTHTVFNWVAGTLVTLDQGHLGYGIGDQPYEFWKKLRDFMKTDTNTVHIADLQLSTCGFYI